MKYILFIFFPLFCLFLNVTDGFAMKEWEKRVYRETKNVRRIPAAMAYQMFLTGKSLIVSVDRENEYETRRIVESINIPGQKFTESFIKKIKSKLLKYRYVILYCK